MGFVVSIVSISCNFHICIQGYVAFVAMKGLNEVGFCTFVKTSRFMAGKTENLAGQLDFLQNAVMHHKVRKILGRIPLEKRELSSPS